MTTTLEKFAGSRAGNYCTLPTIDVAILPESLDCLECRAPIVAVEPACMFRYAHVVEAPGCSLARPRPLPRCRYCGDADALEHDRGSAWADYVRCSRCGGVDGFPLGD